MPIDNYVAVPGSERKPVAGAKKTGAPNPDETIEVTVVIRGRAATVGEVTAEELVARGIRVSREEYESQYGADPGDIEKVKAFATAMRLNVVGVDPAARTVVLSGTSLALSAAFQQELAMYRTPEGVTYRGRTGALHIPAELNGIVLSVHGLDNRVQATPHFRLAEMRIAHAGQSIAYSALQVAAAYNFPSNLDGKGQTVAIIELGGGFKAADLTAYFASLNISPEPSVIAVSVDGAQNQPTGSTSGPDTEVMLDIEIIGAVARAANIVVYFAPNTDAGFLNAINQAVLDKVNKPSVISISWGGPESTWTAQSLQSYNIALQAAALVGVTVCAASGDNGSTDGVADGKPHVDFPASSPYVLACGGTRLDITGTSIASETVWNDLPSNGATGGGVSQTFPLPPWQANAGVPSSPKSAFRGRGVPDVSGDADPATGYRIEADGTTISVGGTSAVAPLFAGLIALFNQSLSKSVGFLNPVLYKSLGNAPGAFQDITSGNNGDYRAGPGWDACTGWGSPNGANLLRLLASSTTGSPHPVPPPPKHRRKHKK
jgi:kumamolisin